MASWVEKQHGPPETVTTNEIGLAKISYPKWVSRQSGLLTKVLVVEVNHPEYCFEDTTEITVPQPGAITLIPRIHPQPGGRLKVKLVRENSAEPVERFRAIISADRRERSWKREGDVRLSPILTAARHVIRFVDYTDAESLQFSDPIIVDIVADQTQELEIPLRRGMAVRGELDAPKPVRGGYVTVNILDSANNPPANYDDFIHWQTWTTVDEDGKFEFRSLPHSASLR